MSDIKDTYRSGGEEGKKRKWRGEKLSRYLLDNLYFPYNVKDKHHLLMIRYLEKG